MPAIILPTASFPDLSLSRPQVSQGRHLPRWEANGAIYHIALHLADSVPQTQLDIWRAERERLQELACAARRPLTDDEVAALKVVYHEHVEKYLNAGYGECLLRNNEVSTAVANVLAHDNGKSYALHEWCIMPNHLHIIVGGFQATSYCSCPHEQIAAPEGRSSTGVAAPEGRSSTMRDVVATWKRVSGHLINKVLGHTGPVWHRDAYTRIIRDRVEYGHQMSYVWNNPEVAGLSSGFLRERYI